MSNEPNWNDSKTLLCELWKNPLFPMNERLEMADGAVAYRNEVIANLRNRIAELEKDARPRLLQFPEDAIPLAFTAKDGDA